MVNAPAPTDKSSTRILPSNPASSSPLLGEGNLDSSQEDTASRAIQRTRKPGVYTVPERRASVRKRPSNPSSTEGVTARQASSSLKEKANSPGSRPSWPACRFCKLSIKTSFNRSQVSGQPPLPFSTEKY